jgi:DNA-binding PadR family transcriptional regulator
VYRNTNQKGGPAVRIFVDGARGWRSRKGWHMRQGQGHGRGRGRGRGGHRRALDHGHLRLLLLQLIAEEPRHGYDLIREIEARTEGAYVPSPGVIYPALEALLDLGWAAAETDGSRRSFRVTPEGAAQLDAEAEHLAQIRDRLGALRQSEAPEDPEDVRGAMRRLRHAVIQAYRARSDDGDHRKAIADILGEAQERIGKLSGD